MKLYERYGDSGFHTCIATTFGVDFDAYENIVLPRLRGAGCFNNVLLADGRMLTYALDGASPLPRYAGRHYTIASVLAKGVFHPKITLQLGRRSGRLIIASANMTVPGLAGNLELAGLIDCTPEDGGERQLVAAAWHYLNGVFIKDEQALAHQLEWMRRRTAWLFDTEPAAGPVTLADGKAASLLTSDTTKGLGARFAALVEERPVNRLIVLSPYWDENLVALKFLMEELQPRETIILIDTAKALFPARAAKDLPNAAIFDLEEFGKKRFIHAKAIIAETGAADHVLYGSANCAAAALGTQSFAGTNAEACLYRRLLPNTLLESLGLANIIATASPLPPAALPAFRTDEELPLADAARRSPGRFECMFDTLVWWPPASIDPNPAIELLDPNGQLLPARLTVIPSGAENRRRFQISGTAERPAFARLRFADGTASAPTVVMVVDALRETVREARSKRAESAALQLSEETEEGLWLWEVLNELETAEAALDRQDDPGTRRTHQSADDTENAEGFRTLAYEQFIAGRRIRSDETGTTRNSLAGSELSLVRNFLNRVLSIGEDCMQDTDDAAIEGLDLGDETADAAQAMEGGEEFAAPSEPDASAPADEEAEARKAAREKVTREQIVQAVQRFNERIREKAEAGQITPFDVLRLRVILTIAAAAGQPTAKAHTHLTSLQVLPLDNSEEGWPKLMGRLLFTFFGGKKPAIRQLALKEIYDQIPDDILECWATALWASQACMIAATAHNPLQQSILPALTRLTQQIYAQTGLRPDELKSDRITAVFDKLNARFANRLGLPPDQIEEGHTRTIKKVKSPVLTE